MSRGIVCLCIVVTGDLDRQLKRCDLQFTVGHCKILIGFKYVVARSDCEESLVKAHRISVNIRTLRFSSLSGCQSNTDTFGSGCSPLTISHLVLDCVSCYALFTAVICFGVRITGDLHLQFGHPDRVHILIGSTLISSHLCNYRSSCAVYMERSIYIIQIWGGRRCGRRSIAGLRILRPSDELITGSCKSAGNRHRLVDQYRLVFTERFRSIIPEPVDVGFLGAFQRFVFRTKLNRIGLLLYPQCLPLFIRNRIAFLINFFDHIAVFVEVISVVIRNIYRISIIVCNKFSSCVFSLYTKGLPGIDLAVGHINIGRSVPLLHNPVGKHLLVRSRDRRLGYSLGLVFIKICIFSMACPAVQVVDQSDTISSAQYLTPLGVQIEFLGDPRSVNVII